MYLTVYFSYESDLNWLAKAVLSAEPFLITQKKCGTGVPIVATASASNTRPRKAIVLSC